MRGAVVSWHQPGWGEVPQHVGLSGLGAFKGKVKPTALSEEEAISLSTCQQGRDKLENSEGC